MSYVFQTTPVYRANLEATEDIIINPGGTDCFAGDTKVVTNEGLKEISQLKSGDMVKSFNGKTDVFAKVAFVKRFKNKKKTIRIKMKNGSEIICTEDHKFCFSGEWCEIKNILDLLNGNMEGHS